MLGSQLKQIVAGTENVAPQHALTNNRQLTPDNSEIKNQNQRLRRLPLKL